MSHMTDTAAFKRWFGNSQVVDAQGEPLVVHHGTRASFEAFDRKFISPGARLGPGFYFTTDPRTVDVYKDGTGSVISVFLRMENPYRGGPLTHEQIEAFWGAIHTSTFSNGYDATETQRVYREFMHENPQGLSHSYLLSSIIYTLPEEWMEGMKAMGYDGLIANGPHSYPEYVVFDPCQIKSIDNVGTFSAEDPRFRHNPSRRGPR